MEKITLLSPEKGFPVLVHEVLADIKTAVITSHISPDGDAIGSVVAFWCLLRQMNINARIILSDAMPDNLAYVDESNCVEHYNPELHNTTIADADLIAVLDVNVLHRVGELQHQIQSSKAKKIVIDHHIDPQPFADLYIVDTEECATCALVTRLAQYMNFSFTKQFSLAAYTGIMTDTGNFRYPRTTDVTFMLAAELIRGGADPVYIYDQFHNTGTLHRTRLLGEALANMEVYQGGAVCAIGIKKDRMQFYGLEKKDTDGYVQHTLSLGGVVVGILVVETEEGVRASIRSKGDFPANAIAARFGGGGHKNAAGLRMSNETLESALPKILLVVSEFLPHEHAQGEDLIELVTR